MCLAIPGKIISIDETDPLLPVALVDFAGVQRSVHLAFLTEVSIGDFVIVHVGFAISKIDETEARKVFEELDRIQNLD